MKIIDDILLYVFLFLDIKELGKIGTISKRFNKLSNDDNLWKKLYIDKYLLHNHILLPNPYKTWKIYLKNRINIKDKLNNVFKNNYKMIYKNGTCMSCYLEKNFSKIDLEWINWSMRSKCDKHKHRILFNDINQQIVLKCGKKMIINKEYYYVLVTYYDGIHKVVFNAWNIKDSHPCTLLINIKDC